MRKALVTIHGARLRRRRPDGRCRRWGKRGKYAQIELLDDC